MSEQTGPGSKREKELREKYGLDKTADAPPQFAAVGIELAGIVIVMGAIGFGIDKLAGTSPWCLLGLCLIGIFGGLYRLVRKVSR